MIFDGRVHKPLAEASKELGFSVWYLRKLCRDGSIPFKAYGKRFYVDVDKCKKLIGAKSEAKISGRTNSRSLSDLI